MNIPFYNNIDLKNNKIINVANPENDTDIANKLYIDTSINTAKQELNESILLQNTQLTDYIDEQVQTINENLTTNVTNILIDNIVDNVASSESSKALSANMGHYLLTLIDDMNKSITEVSDNINLYSTTPTIIGTYNNHALYRVLVQQEIGPSSSQTIQLDLSNIINENISVVNTGGHYSIVNSDTDTEDYSTYSINHNNTTETIGVYINDYNAKSKVLNIYVGANTITQLENQTIDICIEYYINEQ